MIEVLVSPLLESGALADSSFDIVGLRYMKR